MLDDDPDLAVAVRDTAASRDAHGGGWLCCGVCGHRVTLASAAVSFDGGHEHAFSNPGGYRFRIALFDPAPGCDHDDAPTEYFSWFPGYAWRVAACGGCGAHLGWVFDCVGAPGRGEPHGFHGLIVERLQAR